MVKPVIKNFVLQGSSNFFFAETRLQKERTMKLKLSLVILRMIKLLLGAKYQAL